MGVSHGLSGGDGKGSPSSGGNRRRPPSPKQVAHRKAWGEQWSAALRQIARERKPK